MYKKSSVHLARLTNPTFRKRIHTSSRNGCNILKQLIYSLSNKRLAKINKKCTTVLHSNLMKKFISQFNEIYKLQSENSIVIGRA